MNEIELIRQQIAAERQHASAVANACARALGRAGAEALTGGSRLGEFRQACVEYLVCVLTSFEERDQRLGARRAFDEVLARRGGSREALEKLEAALAGTTNPPRQQSWREFVQFFDGVWGARRDAIDGQLARQASTADWRFVGGIDADSVLEERRRYARVVDTLPAGESLAVSEPAREP